MTLKHSCKAIFEKCLGVKILRPTEVHLAFEEIHLKQFFNRYEVDCVFDVGANEGQYALLLRERIGYSGPIISFEPMPSAVSILKTKSDVDQNWHLEPVALGTCSGNRLFNIMKHSQFSSFNLPFLSEVDPINKINVVSEQITVAVSTLSVMYRKYKDILKFARPFLKIDTQGADLSVVEGAGDDLDSFVGLQSELSIKPIYVGTPDYREALDYYFERGFELSALVPNNEGHFPRLMEIDCILYNKFVEAGLSAVS